MSERDGTGKRKAQEGGFRFRQEFHQSEPTLNGHLETLEMLRRAKEDGMKRVTVLSPDGPITLPLGEMIKVVEKLIEDRIGNLPSTKR